MEYIPQDTELKLTGEFFEKHMKKPVKSNAEKQPPSDTSQVTKKNSQRSTTLNDNLSASITHINTDHQHSSVTNSITSKHQTHR